MKYGGFPVKTRPDWLIAASLLLLSVPVAAQEIREPVLQKLDTVTVQQIVLRPSLLSSRTSDVAVEAGEVEVRTAPTTLRGACPDEILTHSDSDWGPGEYIVQAGFAQGETAAGYYTVDADQFPLRLDLFEVLFATSNAIGQTTTQWTVRIYRGTPDTGGLVAEFSSDDIVLPHLVMPPGTTGTILQFLVDPQDPEQIFIDDDGTQGFTIGVRVDQHNDPGSPCLEAPNQNNNAFPCTDTSGLDVSSGNWLDLVTGPFCLCGQGWLNFQSLPVICRPSGDWVMRATVTPQGCAPVTGACCRGNGTCTDGFTEAECDTVGGSYQGDAVACADVDCPAPTGACCVEATGECIQVDAELCSLGGGLFYGSESCSDFTCFPVGSCCLPDGTCVDAVNPEVCELGGGTFQGDGTTCSAADCPQPLGACCFASGTCTELEEGICLAFGALWLGMDTTCTADACVTEPCDGDVDEDGIVGVDDLLLVIGQWACGGVCSADVDDDGFVGVDDLLIVIGSWGGCS